MKPKPTCKMVHSGRMIDLSDVQAEDICIRDIAVGLDGINRFDGAHGKFFSVAAHSLHCLWRIRQRTDQPIYHLDALLHDAAEYLTGDRSTPMKLTCQEEELYSSVTKHIEGAIQDHLLTSYGVDTIADRHRTLTKMVDMEALNAEAWELFDNTPQIEWRDTFYADEAERAFVRDHMKTTYRNRPGGMVSTFLSEFNTIIRQLQES